MTVTFDAFLGDLVEIDELRWPRAIAVSRFAQAHPELGASLIAVRRNADGTELVVLEIRADIAQRPVIPVQDVEQIAIAFTEQDGLPMFLPLRTDFPAAPHTNETPDGFPVSLCLYQEAWSEVRLSLTAGSLIQRVRWWLEQAAEGELYAHDHPLEPFFFPAPFNMVMKRDLFMEFFGNRSPAQKLVARSVGTEAARMWVLQRAGEPDPHFHGLRAMDFTFLEAATPMIADGRVRHAPHTLASLVDMFAPLGLDLLSVVREQLQALMANAETQKTKFALIVAVQIAPHEKGETPDLQLMCFLAGQTIADAAVAVGEYSRIDVQYGRLLPGDSSKRGEDINLMPVNIGMELDPLGAAELSGRPQDERKIVLAGAGSLGSSIFDALMRQGFGSWTIIDSDHVSTHNLARHTMHRGMLGAGKAESLSLTSTSVLGGATQPVHIKADLLAPEDKAPDVRIALDSADLIIDATASAAASRLLARDAAPARRASLFLLGDANAIAVLIEDKNRTIRLDDLETTFVSAALSENSVADLLRLLPTLSPTPASCRAPTSRAPWPKITGLAACAAELVRSKLEQDEAVIALACWGDDAGISVQALPVQRFEESSFDDWQVRLSRPLVDELRALRNSKLPAETGGLLLGAVDAWNKTIHVSGHISDIQDSAGTPSSFQRGLSGLHDSLAAVKERSNGAIAYVGEWHSHPKRATANPSKDDLVQLLGISDMLLVDDRPAISVIIADEEENVLLARRGNQ